MTEDGEGREIKSVGGGGEGSNEKEGRGHLPWEESCAEGDKMGIPAAGGADSAFLMLAGARLWAGVRAMGSPVLGWGEARGAAAAVAGQRLHGGAHVVMAEGQEAAGGARVQHARAVEEGEAALGQGSLEGTELGPVSGLHPVKYTVPSPALESLPCVHGLADLWHPLPRPELRS